MRSKSRKRQATVKKVRRSSRQRDEHEVTHATFRSWCGACVAGRATEGSHKRSATEPSVPLGAMDYGFLGRDADVQGGREGATWGAGVALHFPNPHARGEERNMHIT